MIAPARYSEQRERELATYVRTHPVIQRLGLSDIRIDDSGHGYIIYGTEPDGSETWLHDSELRSSVYVPSRAQIQARMDALNCGAIAIDHGNNTAGRGYRWHREKAGGKTEDEWMAERVAAIESGEAERMLPAVQRVRNGVVQRSCKGA